jgi:thiol-disulfide isomerase/thioredoxin
MHVNTQRWFKTALVIVSVAMLSPLARTSRADGDVRGKLAAHRLAGLDGSATTLAAYRGDVVVVNFWASWCGPCRKELPIMDGWNQAWAGRGARVVAISIDKDERKARRFAKEAGLSLPVFHDGPDGLARAIDLPSLPCTFLLDRDGRVVTVVRSSSPDDLTALHKQAEALISQSGKPEVQRAGMSSDASSPSQEGPR